MQGKAEENSNQSNRYFHLQHEVFKVFLQMKNKYQVPISILVLFPAIALNGKNALVKLLVKWRLGENDPPEDVTYKKDASIDSPTS